LAQQNSDFIGDYTGSLASLHIKLHITAGQGNGLAATVDSPEQQLFALPCTDFVVNGSVLSFSVPNVRGEWTGLLSPDHMTLSGVWKQGRPMPLNFTRGTESLSSGTAPITPSLRAIRGTSSPTVVSGERPSCSGISSVSYWNGSAWNPMTMTAHMGKEAGGSFRDAIRNPLSPRSGITKITTFKDSAAALSLDPKPIFCVTIPQGYDPTSVMVGSIDVKNDHRELETCAGACASRGRASDDWLSPKRVQPMEVKRISPSAVEFTPKSPLSTGQYIISGSPLADYFDFGVAAGVIQ
jgi:hypothetical protein